MKAEQLVTLITEEVRKAVRQEIGTLLKEAVEYASRPEIGNNPEVNVSSLGVKQKVPQSLGKPSSSTSRELFEKYNPISRILEDTEREMKTSPDPAFTQTGGEEDYSSNGVVEGIDISKLGFLDRAKQIHKKLI